MAKPVKQKKGFFAKMFEKLDKNLESKSKCSCSSCDCEKKPKKSKK